MGFYGVSMGFYGVKRRTGRPSTGETRNLYVRKVFFLFYFCVENMPSPNIWDCPLRACFGSNTVKLVFYLILFMFFYCLVEKFWVGCFLKMLYLILFLFVDKYVSVTILHYAICTCRNLVNPGTYILVYRSLVNLGYIRTEEFF